MAHHDFDVVFYHKGCIDGFTSASIVRQHLPLVAIHPIGYQEPFPVEIDTLRGSDILFVDFCPDDAILDHLARICNLVVVLDHHVTAQKRCLDKCCMFVAGMEGSFEAALEFHRNAKDARALASFDMKKSGARLTWEFFNGTASAPRLVHYTEDYDLWKKVLGDTNEMNAFIQSVPFDFSQYRGLHQMLETEVGCIEAVRGGAAILRYEDKLIKAMMAQARQDVITLPSGKAYKVMAVNSPVLQSRLGNDLALISPTGIGVVYNVVSPILTKVSVRSIREVDITPITTAFGGGGHKNAGGYEIRGLDK